MNASTKKNYFLGLINEPEDVGNMFHLNDSNIHPDHAGSIFILVLTQQNEFHSNTFLAQ
jgi:hypothetical protein